MKTELKNRINKELESIIRSKNIVFGDNDVEIHKLKQDIAFISASLSELMKEVLEK